MEEPTDNIMEIVMLAQGVLDRFKTLRTKPGRRERHTIWAMHRIMDLCGVKEIPEHETTART